jgi:sugar-specific transcriptional regulator TrmB
MDLELLEDIGLTKSEIKVYISLIEIGSSSVGPIVSKAKIASSKIYEILDKLADKGLVTTFMQDHVKHFKPVNPKRLMDYLETKKQELNKKEDELKELLPQLNQLYSEKEQEFEVEVFKGYKGVYNALMEMIGTLKKGEEHLVMGGGDTPTTNPRTRLFFENIHQKRSEKGIKLRIIFNEIRRKSYKNMSIFPHTNPRYIDFGMPSTINIYGDTTILLTMSPVPAGIRIKDKNITASYKKYFERMWKMAKK